MRAPGRHILRSLSIKLALISLVLGAVPVLIYGLLADADDQKNTLILRSVQQEGRILANALFPELEQFSPEVAENLQSRLMQLAPDDAQVAVFFRSEDMAEDNAFLFVARHPRLSESEVQTTIDELGATGLLNDVSAACDRRRPLSLPRERSDGTEQILTYFGTRRSTSGCWAVISSTDRTAILGSAEDGEYWKSDPIRFAAVIYAAMAILIISVFVSLRHNLRRFDEAIAEILSGKDRSVSFQDRNLIPELSQVAGRFDRLVSALRRADKDIRQAAEENAHALKAPLAVISQSIEPFRALVEGSNTPAARSLDRIESSIDRLDGLISAARFLDESTSASIDAPLEPIDLERVMTRILEQYRPIASHRNIRIDAVVPTGARVLANDDLLLRALENILENALDFSPEGGVVLVHVQETESRQWCVSISDKGPGVDASLLDHLFDRYYSTRSGNPNGSNFGIGLWIVRRNALAMNGSACARNIPGGGLCIELELGRFG